MAREKGPQRVTRHGKEAVVVVSVEEFTRLKKCRNRKQNIVDFFRSSPLVGSGINLDREPDYGREIDL